MKKLVITAALTAFFYAGYAQTTEPKQTRSSEALVNQEDGYYIFMFSRPQKQYEVLGTIEKSGLVWSGKPREMMNIILRRVKKNYPKADGIIFKGVAMDEAEAIKFSE